MKNMEKKWNWIVDALLLAVFLMTFFIDQTGLAAHQWLGLAAVALASYHMLLHREWCKAVIKKSAGKIAPKICCFGLLDAALLIGFAVILITGLFISTWLQLNPAGTIFFRNVHIASSYIILFLVFIKLAVKAVFGRRKLTGALQSSLTGLFGLRLNTGQGRAADEPAIQPEEFPYFLRRRQFLSLIGVSALTVYLAVNHLRFAGDDPQAETALKRETPASAAPAKTVKTNSAAADTVQKSVPSAPQTAAAETSAPAALAPQVTATAGAASGCTIFCSKQCVFPGSCRRYTDRNGNGKCDFGECR